MLKKLIGVFKEKISVCSNEEYRDKIASDLMDEGLKMDIVPEEQTA